MDQGYNLEAAELAEKAIKRLNVFKTDVEYLYGKDQYDKDELNYSNATVSGWAQLTVLQKDIVFMHAFQGFSLSGVADLKGISPQAASQAFHRACKHFQTV